MIDLSNPDYSDTPVNPAHFPFGYNPADFYEKPWVTVVTPFFNTGEIFHETAKSIFQQSLQQWEWLIVNDGSSAEFEVILQKYRNIDPRVRVIDHAVNCGLPAARNTGINSAKGDYVYFLDSDDLIEPTTLEKLAWFLLSHPEMMMVNGYSVGFGEKRYLWPYGFEQGESNLETNFIDNSVLIRKSLFAQIGGFDEGMRAGLEDWDYWIKCASHGIWGITIKEYFKWYRTRENHSDRWENLQNAKIEDFKSNAKKKYPFLWSGTFPQPKKVHRSKYSAVELGFPYKNRLRKQKKRLLLVLPYLIVGGADRFNLEMIRLLFGYDFEVTVITTLRHDSNFQSEFAKLTPDIFFMDKFLPYSDYPRFFKYIINSRSIDIVMIQNSEVGYQLLPYLKQTFPNLPIVDFNHALATNNWYGGGWPNVSRIFQPLLDRSLVTAQQIKNWMIENGGRGEKIEVSYINVDTDAWKPDLTWRNELRSRMGASGSTLVIVYNARLVSGKRPDIVLEVIKQLLTNGDDIKLVIIGYGELESYVIDEVRKNDILANNVMILGKLSQDEVKKWLNVGDTIFLPSDSEGIPTVFFEGMSMEMVCVGSDVGGCRELVTPNCGFLVNQVDKKEAVNQYVDIFRSLVNNPEELQIRKTLSRQRVMRNFDLELMGKNINRILCEVLANKTQISRLPDVDCERLEAMWAYGFAEAAFMEYYAAELVIYRNQLMQQVKELEARVTSLLYAPTFPPVNASTYFYFAFRALGWGMYRKLVGVSPSIVGLKNRIKHFFVDPKYRYEKQ